MFIDSRKMTKRKYIDYTFEDLIHDQEFVDRIQDIYTEREWRKFLETHYESKENILKAKRFISIFQERKGQLDSEHNHELWLRIRDFNRTTCSSQNNRVQLKHIIRIAASVIILLSISSVLFLGLYNREGKYAFSEIENGMNTEKTLLTLTNGERIEIDKEESKIAVLDNEAVKIDNDTIQKKESIKASSEEEFVLNELVVPYGKRTTLILNDGTKVWLNAGTKFAFPQKFIGKNRKVYLDGEGYFEVTQNKKQPFIVSSEKLNVEVLGTKFNMNSYSVDKQSETVLLEGSVLVWSENKLLRNKVEMSPNQKAICSERSKKLTVISEPNAQDYIAWIDGWYKFSNESLEKVLIRISRFYNITFKYEKVKIVNKLPVSGKLDLKESFEEVLFTLSKVAEFEYEVEGNIVMIK